MFFRSCVSPVNWGRRLTCRPPHRACSCVVARCRAFRLEGGVNARAVCATASVRPLDVHRVTPWWRRGRVADTASACLRIGRCRSAAQLKLNDDAGGDGDSDSDQNVVATQLHPVMAARWCGKAVATPIVNHILPAAAEILPYSIGGCPAHRPPATAASPCRQGVLKPGL